jgi:hypothetical protein
MRFSVPEAQPHVTSHSLQVLFSLEIEKGNIAAGRTFRASGSFGT